VKDGAGSARSDRLETAARKLQVLAEEFSNGAVTWPDFRAALVWFEDGIKCLIARDCPADASACFCRLAEAAWELFLEFGEAIAPKVETAGSAQFLNRIMRDQHDLTGQDKWLKNPGSKRATVDNPFRQAASVIRLVLAERAGQGSEPRFITLPIWFQGRDV
jgi:hypothetical protein